MTDEDRVARLEDLVERRLAADSGWSAGQVKEYAERLFAEKERALSMADAERELAASALRGEQQRALDAATAERDKAAEKLRAELARSIDEGDDRLREHILNQVGQIHSALVSSEKLEIERVAGLAERVGALSILLETFRVESEHAQTKFESSVEGRFSQVNEFRGSLSDLGKQMATRRELESFVTNLTDEMNKARDERLLMANRRELETGLANVTDKVEKARDERQHQINDLRSTMDELRSRVDVGAPQIPELQKFVNAVEGERKGQDRTRTGAHMNINSVVGIIGVVFAVIFIAIAMLNYSAQNNSPPPTVTVTTGQPTP